MKLNKTLCLAVALTTAILSFSSCSKDEVTQVVTQSSNKTQLNISLDSEGFVESETNGGLRTVTFDPTNLTANGFPRLSVTNTLPSHVFVFDPTSKTLIGYTQIDWKLKKAANGKIEFSFNGEKDIFKASFDLSNGQVNISSTDKLRLVQGTSYHFVCIAGGGTLRLDHHPDYFSGNGPSVLFDGLASEIAENTGNIPYGFQQTITATGDDKVKYPAEGAVSTAKMHPLVPVVRIIINNPTNRNLQSGDLMLTTERLQSEVLFSAVRINTAGGSIQAVYATEARRKQGAVNRHTRTLPLSVPAGETKTFYMPMTTAEPTAPTPAVIEIATTTSSALKIERPNGTPFVYTETDANRARTNWLPSTTRFSMHTINLKTAIK